MEEELKCQVCKQLFTIPVLLPCYHSICLNCAVHCQQRVQSGPSHPSTPASNNDSHAHVSTNFLGQPRHIVVTTATVHHHSDSSISSGIGGSGTGRGSDTSLETEDGSDKISILSDTDSGVVVYGGSHSRPNSSISSANMHGLLFPPIQSTVFSLSCPICQKLVYFDEHGVSNLPKYRIMQSVVDKYVESRNLGVKCQLCEKNPRLATVMCEQCEIFYCEKCLESCHPARGPFAKHSLLSPQEGKVQLKLKSGPLEYKCPDHPPLPLNMFCILCKIPICAGCLQERKHSDHDVQHIHLMSKAQKTELSHNLQQLSKKAKSGSEFIQRLKDQTEKVNENCIGLEDLVSAQVDGITETLQQRKTELLTYIRREKEYKLRSLKTEVSSHSQRLQQTTGLIQFCIEALKDTDPSAFLQIGSLLLARVANMETAWQSDDDSASSSDGYNMQISPGKSSSGSSSSSSSSCYNSVLFNPDFDLTLDDRCVLAAINQLNFIQMKPPGQAVVIPDECNSENNSVTIAWLPPPASFIEGYVLEIDDGARGPFREVYCGKETICTVDGLHFNSIYNARIKAFNSTGEGEYSQVISLQTAGVAWFTFDQAIAPQGVRLSNENCTITSDSYEPRVVLGTVGFARGIHYWEYIVDKYDANADPSFGIARLDVSKEEMLGKDDKGWGMYVDHQRSWFMSSGMHSARTEGGIGTGATIGVLLDLEKRQLSFYVNEEQQGPIAFTNLCGVFYPAVSINCNVTLTLRTSMDPPADCTDADSGIRC